VRAFDASATVTAATPPPAGRRPSTLTRGARGGWENLPRSQAGIPAHWRVARPFIPPEGASLRGWWTREAVSRMTAVVGGVRIAIGARSWGCGEAPCPHSRFQLPYPLAMRDSFAVVDTANRGPGRVPRQNQKEMVSRRTFPGDKSVVMAGDRLLGAWDTSTPALGQGWQVEAYPRCNGVRPILPILRGEILRVWGDGTALDRPGDRVVAGSWLVVEGYDVSALPRRWGRSSIGSQSMAASSCAHSTRTAGPC